MAIFSELVDQTVEKTTFEEKEDIKIQKNIAPIPEPNKKDILRNQRSPFSVELYLTEYFMYKC